MDGSILGGVIISLVAFGLGMWIKRKPKLTGTICAVTGESAEFLETLSKALADGKLNKKELNDCIKKAVDVRDLITKIVRQ